MIQTTSSNIAQIEYWNTKAGETWAKFQEALDRQIEGLGLAAMDALKPKEGEHIIDIGCGCGQTSLDLGSRVGAAGSVVGGDISKPMLEVARRRPRPAPDLRVTFRLLDAESDDLGGGCFDAGFSRFGVMFFGDPVVAFTNIRRSLKLSGRLVFVCRRPLNQNPWMRAPLEAALPLFATHRASRSHGTRTFYIRRRGPGSINTPRLTWILSFAHAVAIALVICTMPPLLAAYAVANGIRY